MKAEIQTAWAQRLRKGDIQKAAGMLVGEIEEGEVKTACCLGVLSVMAIEADVPGLRVGRTTIEYQRLDGSWTNEHSETLPPQVMDWAGTGSDNPKLLLNDDGEPRHAVNLNDDDGYSFEQIADAIEDAAKEGRNL